MREFDLIDKIAKTLGRRGERVLRGAGDDAAVVRADGVTATSVEAFVEGVHFRLATTSLRDLGYKCLVVHDACATRDQEFEGVFVPAAEVHAAFMAALRFGYAKLVTTEEYLAGKAQ